MSYFMVEFDLPDPLPAEFIVQIPEQRQKVNRLLQEQKVLMYALASDRSKVWSVMVAKDSFEIMHILADLPIIQFAEPSITELAFHNAMRFVFPAISLN